MSHEIYEVISDRFSLSDPSQYLLTGTWPSGGEVSACLDGCAIQAGVERSESASALERARDPDRNWELKAQVRVTLPEELPEKGALEIFYENSQGKGLWYKISAKELKRRRGAPQVYLEQVIVGPREVRLRGWAIAQAPVEIRLSDDQGHALQAPILRNPRPDVEQVFSEVAPIRERWPVKDSPGFYIELPKPTGASLTLTFESQGKSLVVPIYLWRSLRALQKAQGYTHKGVRYFKAHGARALWGKLGGKVSERQEREPVYEQWEKSHRVSPKKLREQRQTRFPISPKISIVVPLYKTPERFLKQLIGSIREQSYENWELVLSDGSGPEVNLSPLVKRLGGGDERIRCIKSEGPLPIAANTNLGIAAATGDFLAFADHDDTLTGDALYEVVKAINAHPQAGLIYSDEDKMSLDGHKYFQPHFKPDFNLHLLCTVNYICHLVVARASLVRSIETQGEILRGAYEGAQDYDLLLRLIERLPKEDILHVPRVLYHWRSHENSTAENPESKTYAFEAGRLAIQEHYKRIGRRGEVTMGEFPGLYRTRFLWTETPRVTILIPNKDQVEMLKRCMDSIAQKSTYRNLDFLIVENNSTQEETEQFYQSLASCPQESTSGVELQKAEAQHHKEPDETRESQEDKPQKTGEPQEGSWDELVGDYQGLPLRILRYRGEFSYAKIHNFAVPRAEGEYVLLLNNDTEMIDPDAIEEMLSFAMEPEVGAVGARLYYEDDTIQHAGVVIGFGSIAGHCFVQQPRGFTGYMHRIICTQEYSAVTAACMLTRKSDYLQVEGLCEELAIAFNDIDYCLKLRRSGKKIVYAPYAQFYHYESKSRGLEDTPEKIARFNREIQVFEKRWADILRDGDPYYNPNLTLKSQDFSLKRE